MELASRWGVTLKTLGAWMSEGDNPPIVNQPLPKEEPIIVNLAPIVLRKYTRKTKDHEDKETAVLHIADGHAGAITVSFNEEIYQARMDTLFDSAMTIITLHRKMYDIDTLRIVDTGDNVQGEQPHQGAKVGSIKMGVRDQIAKLALPTLIKLICSLKQEFAEVIFDGFAGNHGHEMLAPETSRADLSLYDLIAAKLGDHKGITINIHESFGEIIKIEGFKFFCTHFDGIPCQQGIPYFAIDRRLKAWYMQFGGFNYALGGHFHKEHQDEVSSRLKYFMAGSLKTDDEWALKKLGISSAPSQSIYGVHFEHGVSWRYSLVVDKKFLPIRES